MVEKQHREACALCGLEITGHPVVGRFDDEEKHFCCQGCARVYEIAHDKGMLDQIKPSVGGQKRGRTTHKQPSLTKLVYAPASTAHFELHGMWCAGCATTAEEVLRKQPGVKDVAISFAAEQGRIEYDPAGADPDAVLSTLDKLGYRARVLTDEMDQRDARLEQRIVLQLIVAVAFGMQVMLLYLALLYPAYASGQGKTLQTQRIEYLAWVLATPILVFGGFSFLVGAWRALRAGTASMDTLVALGTLSAYGYSVYVTLTGRGEAYFDSVAMITTFIMVGRYLEKVGGAQARKDIRHLLSLQPERAWRRKDDTWESVQARTLRLEDIILIKPGERVPADAEIVEGSAAINGALLTGESAPVNMVAGDTVFAGTVVTDDALVCRVIRPIQETRLAQVVRLVQETLSIKPPIQRLADRVSAYFAFGIVGLALLSLIGWSLVGRPISQALLAAVAVLVVACPCSLGLATPLALAVVLGRVSRAGALVRNPAALETAAQTRRVAFDKTGTLTQGQLSVVATAVEPATGKTTEEMLRLAVAVEQYSEHPVARAIVGAYSGSIPQAQGFQALRGLGATARILDLQSQQVKVGSARYLGVIETSPLAVAAQAHADRGETVVWVSQNQTVLGWIALRDEPNATARAALEHLSAQGIRSVMLSGDSPYTTKAIAGELGLQEYVGNMSPAEKAQRILQWQSAGEKTAMVGDGVNDAPALAQADLSITTAGGTDVAGETSDIVLTHGDLTLVPWLIDLSRHTRHVIIENLGWAFAYNFVAVPLAALGLIRPMIAALAMATSSLLVVGNSLRLRRLAQRRK